ncbi:MAG: WD40 repeat domain-containing protein [Burkholderiales bacterium]
MADAVLDLGCHCTAALFAGDAPMFALADGTIRRGAGADACLRAHSALLAAVASADRRSLLTSGEDGRVCRTGVSGDPAELAAIPRKWIGSVASSVRGTLAFAAGRSVWLSEAGGPLRELQHPRSVAGIAFSPDGSLLAVARYGGVTLHAVSSATPPAELDWKGIYAALAFSPDGRFLLAFMQDELLHGWRLKDSRHFRMSGYPGRIKDWSWSADGRWLATSGAHAAVLWPFEGEDGPMGSTALEVGAPRGDARVSAVACHPRRDEIALGYADGAIVVASFDDDAAVTLRDAGRSAVSSVAWNSEGSRLAFGSELGECGVLDVRQ